MCDAHDACRTMYIQANISLFHRLWLTGMDPHAYTNNLSLWPVSLKKRSLRTDSRQDPVGGAFKDYEKGIALSIDFIAISLLKCYAQQAPALLQHIGISLSKALQ